MSTKSPSMTARGAAGQAEQGADDSFAEFGSAKYGKGGKKDRKNSKDVLRSGSIMSDYPSLNIQRVLETEEQKGNRRNTSHKEALSDPNLVSAKSCEDCPSYGGFSFDRNGYRRCCRTWKTQTRFTRMLSSCVSIKC